MKTRIRETQTEYVIEEFDGARLLLDISGDESMLINTGKNAMQAVTLSPRDARDLIRVMEGWLANVGE